MCGYNDIPEPCLEPPEDKIIGQCHRCQGDIYDGGGNNFHGYTLCDECYKEAIAIETVLDYINAYPNPFIDFMRDCLIPEDAALNELLECYRDCSDQDYIDWVAS